MTITQTIERTTLSNLVSNEEYCRKVLPFIKADYFDVKEERVVFEEITNFVDKYKRIPTKISLEIEVESRKDLTEDQHKKIGLVDFPKNCSVERCWGGLLLAQV